MTYHGWLLLGLLSCSFFPAIWNFFLAEHRGTIRIWSNLTGVFFKLIFVWIVAQQVFLGHDLRVQFKLLPDVSLQLHADSLSILFLMLSSLLWLLTTIYAIGFLKDDTNRGRFFGFFSLCVTATAGIALSGNLFTLLFFYEMLTLVTYPLVVHAGTPEALRAGKSYLIYTLGGGIFLLLGIVWLWHLNGPLSFVHGGALQKGTLAHTSSLQWIFVFLIGGFGVKAALVPLHGWLPKAMVAPAPVSALLHAVAVVKAGAFGIIRVVHYTYGSDPCQNLGLMGALSGLAALTIIYGSIRALFQDDLKKRLAYSTVSQVSYIILGATMLSPIGVAGGILHIVNQGLMKITLFFCAGNLAKTLGVYQITELDGVGKRMPWTMAAFSVGALGMIGVPPTVGFVTKWTLGRGAVQAGSYWVLLILIASAVLNAGYFLPILYRAWFCPAPEEWPKKAPHTKGETYATLLWPPLITAALVLLFGLLAKGELSPLRWVQFMWGGTWK